MFAKLKSYCCQVKQQSIKLTLFRWQLLGTATREGSTTGLSKTPGQHGKKPGHECWAKQTNITIGRFGENGYFKIKRGTGHCGVSIFFTNTLAWKFALIKQEFDQNFCILHFFVHKRIKEGNKNHLSFYSQPWPTFLQVGSLHYTSAYCAAWNTPQTADKAPLWQ